MGPGSQAAWKSCPSGWDGDLPDRGGRYWRLLLEQMKRLTSLRTAVGLATWGRPRACVSPAALTREMGMIIALSLGAGQRALVVPLVLAGRGAACPLPGTGFPSA